MVRSISLAALRLAAICFMTIMLMDAVIGWSLTHPTASPIPVDIVRYLYASFDRGIIQFKRECAIYDPEVTYTLRPGSCRFANREFDNEYRINSSGLRDTEEALYRPEIIFLGDSVTMGLGVEQEEAFPQLLGRSTATRTLNAGISSYGTARQLLLLRRLDRTDLRQVVIQYWPNDYAENVEFARSGKLEILPAAEYAKTVAEQEAARDYWPGEHTYHTLQAMRSFVGWQLSENADVTQPDPVLQAEAFVGCLERSPVDLAGVHVAMIAANRDFVAAVLRRASQSEVEWVATIDVIDVTSALALDGSRFVIDDHPTRLGHAAIARELAAMLASRNRHTLAPVPADSI
jgi:hypothetical protein